MKPIIRNVAVIAVTCAAAMFASSAYSQGTVGRSAPSQGAVGKAAPPSASSQSDRPKAAPGRLPTADPEQFETLEGAPSQSPTGVPGASEGSSGLQQGLDAVEPEAFGSSTMPYTTSRVAVQILGTSSSAAQTPVTSYPYRATGKLWARFGSNWSVCTASLVGKSILVTAAHCVHQYGRQSAGWANSILWDPATSANSTSGRPYGRYTYRYVAIPGPYFSGTDTCTQAGVVCNNDIAIVVLHSLNGKMAGNVLGWYSYGWNGYSFVTSSVFGNRLMAQITQLGYPVSHDAGFQMQRTDAAGVYFASGNLKNAQIGSAQTGGSSGGPWLTNFGTPPSVSGVSRGQQVVQAIVGVTSYQSSTFGFNRLGASWFGQNAQYPGSNYGGRGAGNIGFLVNYVCSQAAYTASC